jgi:outer membrane protein TolC
MPTNVLTATRAVAIAALLSMSCGEAAAETLDDAWRAALAVDGRLAAAQARTAAAEADLAGARAERLPSITASTSSTHWRDTPAFDFRGAGLPGVLPLFGGDTLNIASAQLSLPLYTGGALAASVSAASAAHDGETRRTDAERQNVKLAVAEAYVGVLRAASALAVARSNTASLAAHARDVEDMRRTGAVPTNDYLAAAVSLADAEQRQLQAESELAIADAAYNRRVGRALDAPVTLEPLAAPLGGAVIGEPLAALVASAQSARPELAELSAASMALRSHATAARAARRPQLAVNGGYAYLENDFLSREDYWFVSVGVRMSLFDSGRSRHATSSFERRADAALAERADLVSAIELEVRAAWQELATARARLGVAENAVAQADENLRVVRDRYRNGEGTNSEVLDAEALRALSASNFDNAGYDMRLAELTLARAVGAL